MNTNKEASETQLKKAEDVAEVALTSLLAAEQEPKSEDFSFPRTVVHNRWNIMDKIGSGGFGAIYRAFDPQTKKKVAIKVEKRVGKSYLEKEVQFYRKLQDFCSQTRTEKPSPLVYWYGLDGQFKVAVFELMGPSLSDLFYSCHRRFSLKTTLMLAEQLISRLEFVHSCGIVHRDVKPGNFVMGLGDKAHQAFVIDFGLSNMWRETSGRHISFNQDSAFRGTHRYASVNSHFKAEQSRRDDLEALGYVLIYFMNGQLPWQSLKVSKHKRRKSIGQFKQRVSIEELTKGLPDAFGKYMRAVKELKFDQKPDYLSLRELFAECFRQFGFIKDFKYDWNREASPSPTLSISDEVPMESTPTPATGNRSRLLSAMGFRAPNALAHQPDVISISSTEQREKAAELKQHVHNTTGWSLPDPAIAATRAADRRPASPALNRSTSNAYCSFSVPPSPSQSPSPLGYSGGTTRSSGPIGRRTQPSTSSNGTMAAPFALRPYNLAAALSSPLGGSLSGSQHTTFSPAPTPPLVMDDVEVITPPSPASPVQADAMNTSGTSSVKLVEPGDGSNSVDLVEEIEAPLRKRKRPIAVVPEASLATPLPPKRRSTRLQLKEQQRTVKTR